MVLVLTPFQVFAYNVDLEENFGRSYAFNQFFLDHFAGCANGDVDYLSNYPCPPGNETTPLASGSPMDRMKYIADNNWIPIAAYAPDSNEMHFYFSGEQNLDYGEADIIQLDKSCANKPLSAFISGHSESDIASINGMIETADLFSFFLNYEPEYELPGISGAQAKDRPVSAVYENFGDYLSLFDSEKILVWVGKNATLKLKAPIAVYLLSLSEDSVLDLSELSVEELKLLEETNYIYNHGGDVIFPADTAPDYQAEFLKKIEFEELDEAAEDAENTALASDDSVLWSDASDWAISELEKALELGLIPAGIIGKDFTQPITRAEFTALSVLLYESLTGPVSITSETNPFTDTNDPEILKAYSIGLTAGTSETTFSPNDLLNREQAATMLTRVYKAATFTDWSLSTDATYPLEYDKPTEFADDASISDWAKDSVYFMASKGVIAGTGDNKFSPRATTPEEEAANYASATREQAVAIAIRILDNLML